MIAEYTGPGFFSSQRRFLLVALTPALFFLACFYVYPTIFNIETSLTDLSMFKLKQGGEWVGHDEAELEINASYERYKGSH